MANVTFAANRQLYSLILVNQATERNAFTTQFNVETSQQVAALQHGVQQANPNATQQELSDASAPYIDARSAQRAANLDEMDAQHAAAARHQTYNLAGQSAEMADLGATTAIQTGVHQHAAQSAKIEYLENQLTGMENDLRHVETVQGVVRDWSTYWPPQPMPQAHDDPHNVIVDTVVDGKRLRVVPGPAQGQEYTNLTQQANAFVAPVIPQDEDPHQRDPETLRTVEGKGYALPDVPVSDDEVKRAILTFDTWPGGCGLLLAAYLALGHHLYQQYVIGILTEAMALVTTGVDCIADLLYGPNRPTLFLVAIRRMGGRGPGIAGWFHAAGPVFSPIWSAGNACAGYLANYEVSCIVGLGGPGPTLAQLAHAGYDRLMVITRNMFFAETCTQGEYISGSTSKGTFMGVCFTGLGLLRADTLRLTHIGYNNPHETWKRIQGHLELDCVFCLLSATVTNSSARGRIRMHGVSSYIYDECIAHKKQLCVVLKQNSAFVTAELGR